MDAVTERCRVCDQLLPECVCSKPSISLAGWIQRGCRQGWIVPLPCEIYNGKPIGNTDRHIQRLWQRILPYPTTQKETTHA